MKKIVATLIALALCLPLWACSSSLEVTETEEEQETVTQVTETKEKIEMPEGEVKLPEGFSVGYSRFDMTPDVPMPTFDGAVAKSVHSPVQMTCTAMSDGEEIFLLFSLDMRGMRKEMVQYAVKMINQTLNMDIPAEHVFMNSTHTHSSPDPDATADGDYIRFQKEFYRLAPIAVKTALLDLTPTKAFVGTATMEEGITFVRRRIMENGRVQINKSASSGAVAYEHEPDLELRIIRFDREDKKDVLLINYQTHHWGAPQGTLSADWIDPFRATVEKELDMHFAYVQGAGGNQNFIGAFGDQKFNSFDDTIPSFMTAVNSALAQESEAALGKLTFSNTACEYDTINATKDGPSGSKRKMNLWAVGFGDIGIAAAPYEMFSLNGMEIRQGSPYKMTFVSAYTNERNGYVPSEISYRYGGYEVDDGTACAPGVGELFANELIRLLGECKSEG